MMAAATAVAQARARQEAADAHVEAVRKELSDLELARDAQVDACPPTPGGLEASTRDLLMALERAPLEGCPESVLSAMRALHSLLATHEAVDEIKARMTLDLRSGGAAPVDGGGLAAGLAAGAADGLDGELLDSLEWEVATEVATEDAMSDAQLAARVRRLVAERRSARDAAAARQGIDGPTDMEEDGVEVLASASGGDGSV